TPACLLHLRRFGDLTRRGAEWSERAYCHAPDTRSDVSVAFAADFRAYRFFPPTPGTAATCFIHAAIWRSSRSPTDLSSTPRVDLPIPTGIAGGTGLSAAPFTNMSLTWLAKPPQQKHQPSPTP